MNKRLLLITSILLLTGFLISNWPEICGLIERVWLASNMAVSNVQIENNTSPTQIVDNNQYVSRSFTWKSGGTRWSWQIPLSKQAYQYFKGIPRIPTDDYSVYVTNPADDTYLDGLVEKFREAKNSDGLSEYEMISLVIAFVQSIPYVEDKIGTGQDEYPKYPLETLYEQSGDCEDKSILMASLLNELGYGTVLLALPNHMAVGVKGSSSLPGTYFSYQGIRYYYLETTTSNWKIGDMPTEVVDSKARILTLTPRAVLTHKWQSSGSLFNYRIIVTVENHGTGPATNTRVHAAFDAASNQVYTQTDSEVITIPPGGKATFTMKIKYPRQVKTRIHVRVINNGMMDGETTSDWFVTR